MKTSTTEELVSELRTIGTEMRTRQEQGKSPEISEPTNRLQQAATQVAMAWSGSNLGYHSRVYYEGLAVPPPDAYFSSEWGSGSYERSQGTIGGWHEYPYDDVVQHIYHLADDPDLTLTRAVSDDARKAFEEAKADVASIISAFLAQHPDEFLTSVKGAIEKLIVLTQSQATRMQLPTGTLMSRDTLAMSQSLQSAPHQGIIGELIAASSVFTACSELGRFASRVAAHIERLNMARGTTRTQGQSIFIGHGQSPLWRELKDFINDRLHLPWEEFNRIPVAGVTNIARLAQMLDSSGIAFLVLLEEGCEELSNIQGLGQIRFPRGRIQMAFEEVRRVLEREGFLDT